MTLKKGKKRKKITQNNRLRNKAMNVSELSETDGFKNEETFLSFSTYIPISKSVLVPT